MNTFSGRIANGTLLTGAFIWMATYGVAPVALAQPRTSPFVVTTLSDSGPGSLRQAILDANERPGPDVINFAPALHGTIVLTSGALRITDSLTVQGPGAFWLTVSGNRASRVFEIEGAGNVVTIDGLTIAHGLAQGSASSGMGGGILLVNNSLTLSRVVLLDNRAVGALSPTATSSTPPSGLGGGIFNMSGNLRVVDSALISNQAVGGDGIAGGPTGGAGLGGGIANEMGTLTLANSVLIANKASGRDGGAGFGGGIVNSGPLTVTNCAFAGNQALGGTGGSALGGGIAFQALPGPVQSTIQGSAFEGNQAIGGPGGTGGNGGTGGTGGTGEGGGLFVGGNNSVTISSATINNNQAEGGNGSNGGNGGNGLGGGIFDDSAATLVLNGSIITRNSALGGVGGTGGSGMGGGIYNLGNLQLGPTAVVSANFASTSSPNVFPPIGQ